MSHSLHITIRIYLKINFEFVTTCCGDSHRFSREKDGARDRVRKRCVFGCAKSRMSHFASPHFRIGTSMRCVSVLIRSNSTAFSSQNDFWPIASESKMKICRSSANEEKRTHSHLKYRAEKNIMCITLLIIIRVLNSAIDRCLDKFSIDFCVTGSRLSGKLQLLSVCHWLTKKQMRQKKMCVLSTERKSNILISRLDCVCVCVCQQR